VESIVDDREVRVEAPTYETFEALAHMQGLALSEELLAAAVIAHVGFWQQVNDLRRVPLTYLDAIEPEAAFTWIRNRGRSC
jgi:hypothetical protein